MPTPNEKKTTIERKTEAEELAASLPDDMRLVSINVENIMKVRVARIKPDGNVLLVGGESESGKTSVLKAIAWALDGVGGIEPDPINDRARTASTVLDFGDIRVVRTYTRVDQEKSAKGNRYMTKLLVEGKRREQFPSPQLVLDALRGKISFDPLEFSRMDNAEQLKVLRKMVTFSVDIDALDMEQKADYDLRRDAGRDFDAAKVKLAALPNPPDALPGTPIVLETVEAKLAATPELVDVAALTQKLQYAAAHNGQVLAAKARKAELENAAVSFEAEAKKIREAALAELNRAEEIDGLGIPPSVPLKMRNKDNAVARTRTSAEGITVGEEIDTTAVGEELNAANDRNAEINRTASFWAQAYIMATADAKWKEIDDRMTERDRKRSEAIAAAKMPVEGLSIVLDKDGDGEVLYNGLPFSQAANAVRIRVSLALGMAMNPKLRVMWIYDGALLGQKNLEMVKAEAAKHNFLVIIERIGTDGKVGVLMEEGEASGDEVVKEEKKG